MISSGIDERRLSTCHGILVVAGGRVVGAVETPIFHGASREPDFLVIRVIDALPGTFRVVSSAVVDDVDIEQWMITVGMTEDAFAALPEGLPFAHRTTSCALS